MNKYEARIQNIENEIQDLNARLLKLKEKQHAFTCVREFTNRATNFCLEFSFPGEHEPMSVIFKSRKNSWRTTPDLTPFEKKQLHRIVCDYIAECIETADDLNK